MIEPLSLSEILATDRLMLATIDLPEKQRLTDEAAASPSGGNRDWRRCAEHLRLPSSRGARDPRFSAALQSKDLDRASGQKALLVTVRDEIDEASYVVGRGLENREVGMRLRDQEPNCSARPTTVVCSNLNSPAATSQFVKFGGLKSSRPPRNAVAGFGVLQLLPGYGPANANRIRRELGRDIARLQRVAEIDPAAAPGAGRIGAQWFLSEDRTPGWKQRFDEYEGQAYDSRS